MTVIPEKLYFKIGEVAQIADVEPYVLRYWETEFKEINPVKSRSNQRLYRRKDIETVLQIKELLYDQGYTIEGAKKKIHESIKDHSHSSKEPSQKELKELEDQMMMFPFSDSEEGKSVDDGRSQQEIKRYDAVLAQLLVELQSLKSSLQTF